MSDLKTKDFNEATLYNKQLEQLFTDTGYSKEQFNKEVSFAITWYNQQAKKDQLNTASIFKAVYDVATVGLSLNPVSKLGYLIGRWDKHSRSVKVGFQPSYKGLINLVSENDKLSNIQAHPVYSCDTFEVDLGTSPNVVHKPDYFSNERKRNNIIGFYAVATLTDGNKFVEVMTKDEVEWIRDNYSDGHKAFEAKKISSSVWEDWFEEMGRKTVLKRLIKYVPFLSDTANKAVELDNEPFLVYDTDYLGDAILKMSEKVSNETEYRQIKAALNNGIGKYEAEKMHADFTERMPNRIEAGSNYNQTDIKEQLEKQGL